jgi:hypothetical protein
MTYIENYWNILKYKVDKDVESPFQTLAFFHGQISCFLEPQCFFIDTRWQSRWWSRWYYYDTIMILLWYYYDTYPIGSMYAIYGNIYHQYIPNVSIYTIHGLNHHPCWTLGPKGTQGHWVPWHRGEPRGPRLGTLFDDPGGPRDVAAGCTGATWCNFIADPN